MFKAPALVSHGAQSFSSVDLLIVQNLLLSHSLAASS